MSYYLREGFRFPVLVGIAIGFLIHWQMPWLLRQAHTIAPLFKIHL
jgi:hypothetical protein